MLVVDWGRGHATREGGFFLERAGYELVMKVRDKSFIGVDCRGFRCRESEDLELEFVLYLDHCVNC